MANEKRLIYAEDLFEPVGQKVFMMRGRGEGKPAAMFGELFRKRIEMAPTVDAVEVVRCKDCKHNKDGFCVGYHAHHDVMPDDFCSYGERRNDG